MRRLLHVSDIHFGPKHDSRAAAAVMRLVEERKPDLVVISGDLTQRAKPEQFREARDWVRRLPVPWISVPGNHDVPLYRVWERVFSPFGAYRDHFQQELEPTFADGEMTVAGVNTAYNWTFKNGRIDKKRLHDLSSRFAGAERSTTSELRPTRIAVLHHPLVPGPGFGDQMVMTHAEEAAEALAEAGVELVLSGHLHYGYLVRSDVAFRRNGARPFWIAHAGTATSTRGRGCEERRNTAFWVEIRPEAFELSHIELEESKWVLRSRHLLPRPQATPGAPGGR